MDGCTTWAVAAFRQELADFIDAETMELMESKILGFIAEIEKGFKT